MDAKVTLSFDQEVIIKAKAFAEREGISLSRLTEHLLRQATSKQYATIEELPISDWVSQVADGAVEYRTRGRKPLKDEYLESRMDTKAKGGKR